MVHNRSRFGKSNIDKAFFVDNTMCYIHDFALPRQTRDGDIIFEPYWTPQFKITDTGDIVYIQARIPQFENDKITIVVNHDMLLISGKKMVETDEEATEFPRRKSSFGTFRRVIYLPRGIDKSKIQAFYKKGIFQIRLPKRDDEKFRTIHIKTE